MKKRLKKKDGMKLSSIQRIEKTYDINGRIIVEVIQMFTPEFSQEEEKIMGFKKK